MLPIQKTRAAALPICKCAACRSHSAAYLFLSSLLGIIKALEVSRSPSGKKKGKFYIISLFRSALKRKDLFFFWIIYFFGVFSLSFCLQRAAHLFQKPAAMQRNTPAARYLVPLSELFDTPEISQRFFHSKKILFEYIFL